MLANDDSKLTLICRHFVDRLAADNSETTQPRYLRCYTGSRLADCIDGIASKLPGVARRSRCNMKRPAKFSVVSKVKSKFRLQQLRHATNFRGRTVRDPLLAIGREDGFQEPLHRQVPRAESFQTARRRFSNR